MTRTSSTLIAACGGILFLAAASSAGEAGEAVNLARAKGAVAIGNGSSGPFLISKLNDGRLDTLGMWCTNGKAGVFGGIKLGDQGVTFDTVRFFLFNGRAAFTGWRLEGSDDCVIDTDPDPGSSAGTAVYDPQLIACDGDGQFANSQAKDPHVVTISFRPVTYRCVILRFPNAAKPPVGVLEMEVFHRAGASSSRSDLGAPPGVGLDSAASTLTLAGPSPLAAILARLTRPAGITISACDAAGQPLREADDLRQGCLLLAKCQSGGGEERFQSDYRCYQVVDASAPPPAPKAAKPPRPAPPPKPPVSIASAPAPAKDVANLIIGTRMTGSISPELGARFAQEGKGNWFLTQQIPQWISVDFGAETAFNYVSISSDQVVRFRLQASSDGVEWKDLLEVDRIRPPYQWNGFLEEARARHLRLVVLKPSWDVHVRRLLVAHLPQAPVAEDGTAASAIRPGTGCSAALPTLPPAPARP